MSVIVRRVVGAVTISVSVLRLPRTDALAMTNTTVNQIPIIGPMAKNLPLKTAKHVAIGILLLAGLLLLLAALSALVVAIASKINEAATSHRTVVYFFSITLFVVGAAAVGILVNDQLKKYAVSQWMKISLFSLYSIAVMVFAAAASVLIGMDRLFGDQEKVYRYPDDCSAVNLKNIIECSGYGRFGFQNNYDYDIRAYGTADAALCRVYQQADFSTSFMNEVKTPEDWPTVMALHSGDGHSCDLTAPAVSWAATDCQFPNHPEIRYCYHCANGLSNQNGHRYALIGFSDDCSSGAYRLMAGWQTQLIERIQGLDSRDP